MALTEEQKERIRKNREKALEIRRKKELESAAAVLDLKKNEGTKQLGRQGKEGLNDTGMNGEAKQTKYEQGEDEEDLELEDFEVGASEHVTKQQAMKLYCLPEGTLRVCSFIEKDNPHQKKFSAMKLYSRSEIRRRARERFGGLEGLVKERRRRELKKLERDLEATQDVFKKVKR